MTLLRWVKTKDGRRQRPDALGYAYRVADPASWNGWLARIAGLAEAELEVVKRTLRVRDQGPQARVAAPVKEAKSVATMAPAVQATPAPKPVPVVASATIPVLQAAVESRPTPPASVASGAAVRKPEIAVAAASAKTQAMPESAAPAMPGTAAPAGVSVKEKSSPWSSRRPGIPTRCSTSIWISKPISASTP